MADDTSPRGVELPPACPASPLPIPTVLCDDAAVNATGNRTFSESKFSLPSNMGTPTSPFILSSPLSLPASPSPFMKSGESTGGGGGGGGGGGASVGAPKQTVDTASATGNPRNKCALAPGHSLMDWIRLGNSGRDLTGVGGRLRAVSPQELARHTTRHDAWLAIRGRVYNITHYIPFHPGGEEELMRGAGTDATKLFDSVHPWVNYDSLLAKCLVGPLRHERPDAEELFGAASPKSDRLREPSKAQELVRKSMENLANCITPVRKKINAKSEENVKNPSRIMQSLIQSSDLPLTISRAGAAAAADAPPPLKCDWIQTSARLTVSVYTGPLANPGAGARLADGALLLEVVTNSWLRTLRVVPETVLCEPLMLKVYAESGKIEVTAQKREPCLWRGCDISSSAAAAAAGRALRCRVVSAARVTHDTTLLSLAADGPVLVPLGHHVRVHCNVDGVEVSRSYTPVHEGWAPSGAGPGGVRLAVKRYAAGACSRHLTDRRVGDVLDLTGPYGDFELLKLRRARRLTLVAAGTGVTPMLGLLRFMLARCNPRSERVDLLFFNKKEEDILFREYFDEIAKADSRFTATHVLSDEPQWAGPRGRVSRDLLAAALGAGAACGERCEHFVCVCGSAEFTAAGLRLLAELGVRDACVHAFMG